MKNYLVLLCYLIYFVIGFVIAEFSKIKNPDKEIENSWITMKESEKNYLLALFLWPIIMLFQFIKKIKKNIT